MSRPTFPATPTVTYGLDLSDLTSHITVLDSDGTVTQQVVIGTNAKAFLSWFDGRPFGRVVVEASTHFRWCSQLLADLGHEVLVANPRRLKLIYGDHDKTDRRDSEKLARLGLFDPTLLHPIHRRSSVKAMGERVPSEVRTEAFHRAAADHLSEETFGLVIAVVGQIEQLPATIGGLDRQIEELCREAWPETELLRQVPGVGPVTALAYVLTVDDPSRFARSRDVGAYLGLVPKRDQSGEVDKQLSITKTGDAFVRRLLMQSANYVLRRPSPDSDLKRWGLAVAERGGRRGRQRAKVGVARKLAVLLHRLWVTAEEYQPLGDASAANRPRPAQA